MATGIPSLPSRGNARPGTVEYDYPKVEHYTDGVREGEGNAPMPSLDDVVNTWKTAQGKLRDAREQCERLTSQLHSAESRLEGAEVAEREAWDALEKLRAWRVG